MCLTLPCLCARGAVPPARLAHVSYAPRPSPLARCETVARVSTCPRVHSRRMLVPVRGFRVVLADGHISLAMLPAMYQGYVLALCLISNFSPFANQTLSIACEYHHHRPRRNFYPKVRRRCTCISTRCLLVRSYNEGIGRPNPTGNLDRSPAFIITSSRQPDAMPLHIYRQASTRRLP